MACPVLQIPERPKLQNGGQLGSIDCRHAARLRCRATDNELAEIEAVDDAVELEERDDQNGAGYQVPDELLSIMTPETVPTPIFDSDEV